MGKTKCIAACLLCCCCILLSACGGKGKEDAGPGGTAGQGGALAGSVQPGGAGQEEQRDADAYYDIQTDTEDFFDVLSLGWRLPTFLGMQFYQGEPVQLWSTRKDDATDVYLCRGDGSTELLFRGLSKDYAYMDWFLDQEGNAYVFGYDEVSEKVIKFDADGKSLYSRKVDFALSQTVCQLPDGSIYLLILDGGSYKLASLDPASGTVSIVDELGWSLGPSAVGAIGDGLLYMDMDGFWEYDLQEKKPRAFLLFEGTSYYEEGYGDSGKKTVRAIRAGEDGSVQILRSNDNAVGNSQDPRKGHGEVETLKLTDTVGEKTPIVMRGIYASGALKEQITLFNQSQTDYYLVLEEVPSDGDIDDYITKTSVEIATGKGPDILCGDWLGDIYSLIQKGVFEDLKPYMDRSGILEEDYFPMAFDSWREGDKIYSVNTYASLYGYRMDEAVLGSREEPDIGTLMDALLAYGENAFYLYRYDAQDILRMFLEGSEDLWGMVDFEKGTCDFGGELFAKILQVSKRYGYDERFNYPVVAESRGFRIITFDSLAEQEKEKKVTSGVLFDDGCHAGARAPYYVMSINAGSSHKEGAWAFLSFLLGEEAQGVFAAHDDIPVLKKAFDEMAAELLTHVGDDDPKRAGVNVYVNGEWTTVWRSVADLTEEKVAEMRAMLEDARAYPIRTEKLLDIIEEEAADYFNGTKDIDEVRRVIKNRVQLYLDERR